MIRTIAIAVLALFGSAADAGQDAYDTAVLKHAACTENAAVELAKKEGQPHELANEALNACKAEEDELAKVTSKEELGRVLGTVLNQRRRTIHETRAGRVKTPRMYCAACGMRPTQDAETGVWRPYRQ